VITRIHNLNDKFFAGFALLVSVGITSIILTFILLPSKGTGDLPNGFLLWLERAESIGFVESFNRTITAYPPFYILIPFLLTKFFGFSFFVSYKIFLLIGLIFLTISIYRISKSVLISVTAYILLLVPTIGLGYGDVFLSALVLLSIKYSLLDKPFVSGVLFSLAVSLKFTPLILLPVIGLILFNNNGGFKNISIVFGKYVGFSGGVLIFPTFICAIFSPFSYLENLKLALLNGYLSGQAFNLGWLITAYRELFGIESERMLVPGVIRFTYIDVHSGLYVAMKYSATLIVLVYLLTKINVILDFATALKISIVVLWIYYTIAPGVHENHLLIISSFCIFIWNLRNFEGYIFSFVLILSIVNPIIFYGLTGETPLLRKIFGIDYTIILSGLNLIIFCIYFIVVLFRRNMKDSKQVKVPGPN
jgi:hypothetical protein